MSTNLARLRLRLQKSLRVFLCNRQKLQIRTFRPPRSLLPTPYRVRAGFDYISNRTWLVFNDSDGANLFWLYLFRPRRKLRHTQITFAAACPQFLQAPRENVSFITYHTGLSNSERYTRDTRWQNGFSGGPLCSGPPFWRREANRSNKPYEVVVAAVLRFARANEPLSALLPSPALSISIEPLK